MTVIDSSGWLEYFMNGDLSEKYAAYLSRTTDLLTPTIVMYEVFKVLKREKGESHALDAALQMDKTNIAFLTGELSYYAANLALEHKLAMADAIVYATATVNGAKLVTSDVDFKGLPGVTYLSLKEG